MFDKRTLGKISAWLNGLFNKTNICHIEHIPLSASVFLAHALKHTFHIPVIHISDGTQSLETAHRDMKTLSPSPETAPLYFPAMEVFGGKQSASDPDITGYRLKVLNMLSAPVSYGKPKEWILATSIQAMMQKTIPESELTRLTIHLSVADKIDMDSVTQTIMRNEYNVTARVSQKCSAAIRGGIIDIWPPAEMWPMRIELFGNLIESIRTFDPITQKSIERTQSISITPTTEMLCSENTIHSSPMDYLSQKTIILWPNYSSANNHALLYEKHCSESGIQQHISSFTEIESIICRTSKLYQLISSSDNTPHEDVTDLKVESYTSPAGFTKGSREPDSIIDKQITIIADLKKYTDKKHKVIIFFNTDGSLRHFEELNKKKLSAGVSLRTGVLSGGFSCSEINLTVIAESNIYGHQKIIDQFYHPYPATRHPGKDAGERIMELSSLEPGDLVVHADYGLGKYLGLFEINFNSKVQEVLTIEYADKAKLHVPVSHSYLLSRYVGMSKRRPKLHRLGGRKWRTEKDRAANSIVDLAAALLETQAKRNLLQGYGFHGDTPWQHDFETSFPYQETPDQYQVIAQVKHDMESRQPMDRLICGDAGYGKTEVAMRAAFKTVMEGKQAAILVPTTVLALQHYETFTERMSQYPVRIEMLSRFCSKSHHDRILDDLKRGSVDLVIGTHSLLQKGVAFKDLGLVIIDEEQRFGVAHKEHFKQLRQLVDVLTMTATPIPRTLYLSMTGTRDISLLQSPPRERMSIRTIITKKTDSVIREAILREINREGQVFFLHNRVMTIESVRQHLEKIVPEASIRVGHGQMPSSELSTVVQDFTAGRFDVLLCTTIIESGMDIPRANTILIDRADRFGIADLYQLRGRVGRSSRQAYAYLMLPVHGQIEPDARRRMDAIKRHSGLSTGFQLALRDLEIRGAGNILGSEQSGHISAIGFGLYCQLLKQAVAKLKGEKIAPIIEVETNLDFISLSANSLDYDNAAVLPYDYIEDETMRIEVYRRIAEASSVTDIEMISNELNDRFGLASPPVTRLLKVAMIRIFCAMAGISYIETRANKLIMKKTGNYLKTGALFPRLKTSSTDEKLDEIINIIQLLQ